MKLQGNMNKPKFDPSKPFEALAEQKPKFDPSQPFEAPEMQESVEPSMGESLMSGVAKGATLSFADEIAGLGEKAGTWLAGQTSNLDPESLKRFEEEQLAGAYERGKKDYIAEELAAQEANPGTFLAGNIAGGALLPVGAIGKGVQSAKGLTGLAKYKALLGTGARLAPMGAAQGIATSIGAADTMEDVNAKDLATAAAIGGGTALVAPAVIGGAADLVKGGVNKLSQGVKAVGDVARSTRLLKPLEVGLETGMSPVKVFDDASVEKALSEGTEALKAPIESARRKIEQNIQVPAEEGLTSLSGELGQQFKGQRDLQYRLIQNELKDAGQNLLSDINKVGGELGEQVSKYKEAILNAPDDLQQTKAVHDFVKKLESEVNKKGGSLSNNPDALRLLDNYKNQIRQAPEKVQQILERVTASGKEPVVKETYKAKGSLAPSQLKSLVDDSQDVQRIGAQLIEQPGKVSSKVINEAAIPEQLKQSSDVEHLLNLLESSRLEAKQHKGTALGYALNEARGTAIKGREELVEKALGAEGVAGSKEAFKGYSAFKNLTDELPEGSEAEKLITQLSDTWSTKEPSAVKMLKSESTLQAIRDLNPELADAAQQAMESVGQKLEALPEAPAASSIQSSLLDAPRSKMGVRQLEQTGEQLGMAKAPLQESLAKGQELSSKYAKATSDLNAINIPDMLSSVAKIEDPTAILANDKVRNIIKIMQDNGLQDEANALIKDPKNFIRQMENVKYMRAPSSGSIGGAAAHITKYLGYAAGKTAKMLSNPIKQGVNVFSTSVAPRLQKFSPEQLEQLAMSAEASGKVEAAKMVRSMMSKDKMAKNAALFMISQQQGLKQDITDLVGTDDSELERP